jgi:hypothetical protein
MVGAQVPATPDVTLADLFRADGHSWLRSHRVPRRYLKVMQAIATCRTAAQGGRLQWCACGFRRYVYFSCRNRHCPQCQTQAKEDWRQSRQRELLPVPYFHQVFTLPHQLNRLVWWSERNQRALLKTLFDATAQTLLLFGRREFGGQVGFTLILHTWDQQLQRHLHLHCLIPSGALAVGGTRWIAGGSQFLFSVRALSKVYRAKYLEQLEMLWQHGALDLPPELAALGNQGRRRWLKRLRKHAWVVYAKKPFAGPQKLLDYLSRYTHRVAISNHRIKSCEEGHVEFTYRDRRDGDRQKRRKLDCHEFIGRFLNHVLPEGFTRIRHYGFLASRNKRKALAQIRLLIGAREPEVSEKLTAAEWLQELLGIDPNRCPCCGEILNETDLRPFYIPFKQIATIIDQPKRGPP